MFISPQLGIMLLYLKLRMLPSGCVSFCASCCF